MRKLIPLWIMLFLVLGSPLLAWLVQPGNEESRLNMATWLGQKNHGSLVTQEIMTTQYSIQDWKRENRFYFAVISEQLSLKSEIKRQLKVANSVRTRLGKKRDNVDVVLLTCRAEDGFEIGGCQLQKDLKMQAEDVVTLLIDYNGRAVLLYDMAAEGNGMLEDIKHLIKFAR